MHGADERRGGGGGGTGLFCLITFTVCHDRKRRTWRRYSQILFGMATLKTEEKKKEEEEVMSEPGQPTQDCFLEQVGKLNQYFAECLQCILESDTLPKECMFCLINRQMCKKSSFSHCPLFSVEPKYQPIHGNSKTIES